MIQLIQRTLWVAGLSLIAALTGCSASQVIDKLPTDMGLPAGAPARPEKPYEYPAVHDMPPPRASVPMTEEEQVRLEKELANARDRQEGRSKASKKAAPAAKKQPNTTENSQTSGAKPNP
jgi:hypothetical protein